MGFNLIFSHISKYQYVFKFSFLCWLNYFTIQLPLVYTAFFPILNFYLCVFLLLVLFGIYPMINLYIESFHFTK